MRHALLITNRGERTSFPPELDVFALIHILLIRCTYRQLAAEVFIDNLARNSSPYLPRLFPYPFP